MGNFINPLQDGRKVLWQLFINMKLEPFYYYFVITKTLNMSNEKWILEISINIYPEKYQRINHTMISIFYTIGEIKVAILHIYGTRAILLLFCDH